MENEVRDRVNATRFDATRLGFTKEICGGRFGLYQEGAPFRRSEHGIDMGTTSGQHTAVFCHLAINSDAGGYEIPKVNSSGRCEHLNGVPFYLKSERVEEHNCT